MPGSSTHPVVAPWWRPVVMDAVCRLAMMARRDAEVIAMAEPKLKAFWQPG